MAGHRHSRGSSRAEIARTRGVIARGEKRRNAEKHRAVGTTRKSCAPTLMQIHSWQARSSRVLSSSPRVAVARSEVTRRNWSRVLLSARRMRMRSNESGIARRFFCFSSPCRFACFQESYLYAHARSIAYHGSGMFVRTFDDTNARWYRSVIGVRESFASADSSRRKFSLFKIKIEILTVVNTLRNAYIILLILFKW